MLSPSRKTNTSFASGSSAPGTPTNRTSFLRGTSSNLNTQSYAPSPNAGKTFTSTSSPSKARAHAPHTARGQSPGPSQSLGTKLTRSHSRLDLVSDLRSYGSTSGESSTSRPGLRPPSPCPSNAAGIKCTSKIPTPTSPSPPPTKTVGSFTVKPRFPPGKPHTSASHGNGSSAKRPQLYAQKSSPSLPPAPPPGILPSRLRSPSTTPQPLQRVPSRTQLRHASAVRRLSSEGLVGKEILQVPSSSERNIRKAPDEDAFWAGGDARSGTNRVSSSMRKVSGLLRREDHHGLKRKDVEHGFNSAPEVSVATTPLPYLCKTLEVAGVGLMADSASMETLMGYKEILNASFLTPQSILDKTDDDDVYYHVWVAVASALEEKPVRKHGIDEVVKLAFTNLLIELGSALTDCIKPRLPHYTFVDPRKLMLQEGIKGAIEQAVAVVEGLEKKGVSKDRVYVSIPATEAGLAVAKRLKEKHGIKANLVFVSGLEQAAACAAAGAAVISMPVDKILTYHELRRGIDFEKMNPHPGWQSIKATACYMNHHELETKVIANGPRSLSEIEHCSSVSTICLTDSQVQPARWVRMRVNRPPGPASHVMSLAKQTPCPPKITEDDRGIRYLSLLSSEARNEAATILHDGLRNWQDASFYLEEVIRKEVEKQVFLCPPSRHHHQRQPQARGSGYGTEGEAGAEMGVMEMDKPMSPRSVILADLEQYERMKRWRSQSVIARDVGLFSNVPGSGSVLVFAGESAASGSTSDPEFESESMLSTVEFPPKSGWDENEDGEDGDDEDMVEVNAQADNCFDENDGGVEIDERVRRYVRGESVEPESLISGSGSGSGSSSGSSLLFTSGTTSTIDDGGGGGESTNANTRHSVPPSPYWTDAEAFENDNGSSASSGDEEEAVDGMVLF